MRYRSVCLLEAERIEYQEAYDRLFLGLAKPFRSYDKASPQLVREIIGKTQDRAVVAGGRRGKDDRNQNTLARPVG